MLSFHYISQITGGDNNINATVGRWEATARARQSCCVIFSLDSSETQTIIRSAGVINNL